MSRSQSQEAVDNLYLAFAVAILLFVSIMAGLLALAYAKYLEKNLEQNVQVPLYQPALVTAGLTFLIVLGSAASSLFADFAGNVALIDLLWRANLSTDCPLGYGNGQCSWDRRYLEPLLAWYAFPFFLTMCVALYGTYFRVRKTMSGLSGSYSEMHRLSLRKTYFATLTAVFFMSGFTTSQMRYPDGCNPEAPICSALLDTFGNAMPGALAALLTTALDPWLNLSGTLKAAVGNQFRLDELFVAPFAALTITRWWQEQTEQKRRMPAPLRQTAERAAAEPFGNSQMSSRPAQSGTETRSVMFSRSELFWLGLISLLLAALSAYVTAQLM